MKELTYEEVLDQIEHQRRFGNRPGAEVSALMLEKLGRPQQNMSVIHIAGTNGKGSVSAFLCSILKEAGIRTGMFTSPHLVDFRERICVDGQMISCEEVTKLGNMLLEEDFGTVPTMFDYCLANGTALLQGQTVSGCRDRDRAWGKIRFNQCNRRAGGYGGHENRV